MNRCNGCGAFLQNDYSDKEGYTSNLNNKLCERCFRIKNYNDYKFIIKDNNDFIKILKSINNTNDLIILVVDLFNFNNSIDEIKKYVNNDILLVLTKRDLLPRSIYDERLITYFKNLKLNIKDVVLISSVKNINFDELYNKINIYKKSKNVYVVGYTNAGKSSMINKLLYNYSSNKSDITTSMLPSTTINNIELEINDSLTIIDTPGLLDEFDIVNYIEPNTLKKIVPNKEIKPITYQIKSEQSIIVEDLLIVNCKSNTNLTFYISNNLNIDRKYKNVFNNNLKQHFIKVKKDEDIVIQGLCFIKASLDTELFISTIDGVGVYTRKSLI